jgi:polyhydroxyalkanoate synthesis regulator phasin
MPINRKSIATVTAGLLAGGAIGFAAGVPGLTSAADAPMVDTVDADLAKKGHDHVDRASRIREVLQPLVDDATIDGDQADAVSQHLVESMRRRGEGHRGGRDLAARSEVVTDLLGIDAETLRAELVAGSTLAEVAVANGVSSDDLVAALVAEAEERIAEHVEEGSLTEEEAAAKLADITDRVSERVNSVAPIGGEGHGPGHRGGDRGGDRGGH